MHCTFVKARDAQGRPFRSEWRKLADLLIVDDGPEEEEHAEDNAAMMEAWTLAISGGTKFVQTTSGEVSVPSNYGEAVRSANSKEWRAAMEAEIASHHKAGTWKLVPAASIPPGRKPVGSTWTYALKRDSAGNIKRFKGRLCAQGFSQVEGYDYYATFANTVGFDAIRMVLAYAAEHDYELHTVDVRTAYLNATLEEELDIWMKQAKGFEETGPNGEPMVYKLVKAIYGLKQGARRWIATLKEGLKTLGFKCCEPDQGMFILSQDDARMIILTYVDDLIIADNCATLRKTVMEGIHTKWETTDISELEWCLGIKVERDRAKRLATLSQELYIKDTAKKFGEESWKSGTRANTPCGEAITDLKKGAPDSKETEEVIDTYRSLIGALLWIANVSRPDVSFAVSTLSRFTSCPEKAHMDAAMRVLKYLQRTRHLKLTFGNLSGKPLCDGLMQTPEGLVAFTDSSWGDEKPASGHAIFLNGSLISWCSRRLKSTPLSSCESEYMAASNAATDVIHQQDLFEDIMGRAVKGPTTIFCDNSAACQLTEDAMSGKRVKHALRRLTYLRELKEEGKVTLKFISGEVNPADIFTKNLAGARFAKLRQMLLSGSAEADTSEQKEVPAHYTYYELDYDSLDENGEPKSIVPYDDLMWP